MALDGRKRRSRAKTNVVRVPPSQQPASWAASYLTFFIGFAIRHYKPLTQTVLYSVRR